MLFCILIGTVSGIHVQLLDLARQGVATPTQQIGGIPTSTGGMLQGNFNHDALKSGHGGIEQSGGALSELLVSPETQCLFPVAVGGVAALLLQ